MLKILLSGKSTKFTGKTFSITAHKVFKPFFPVVRSAHPAEKFFHKGGCIDHILPVGAGSVKTVNTEHQTLIKGRSLAIRVVKVADEPFIIHQPADGTADIGIII